MRRFIFHPIAPQSKNQNQQNQNQQNQTQTNNEKKETKKNFTDKIGDYTDYEEIK